MDAHVSRLAARLAADLRGVFGSRLTALVVFGAHVPDEHGHTASGRDELVRTMALVERMEFADLEACARQQREWERMGLATPLLLAEHDFLRSLDAFPLEFGAIIHRHAVVLGRDPFAEMVVRPDDLRRACEVQARSHVLHLREGYLETGGDPGAIAQLVADSSPALRALLANLALLDGRITADEAELARLAAAADVSPTVIAAVLGMSSSHVPTADGARLFPSYLAAMEGLAAAIDRQVHR